MALYVFREVNRELISMDYMNTPEKDNFTKMITQIRDMIPLEDTQIIHIQEMTEKEKTEMIIDMNEVIRSLLYVLQD